LTARPILTKNRLECTIDLYEVEWPVHASLPPTQWNL
jgi:hypothetical protein